MPHINDITTGILLGCSLIVIRRIIVLNRLITKLRMQVLENTMDKIAATLATATSPDHGVGDDEEAEIEKILFEGMMEGIEN